MFCRWVALALVLSPTAATAETALDVQTLHLSADPNGVFTTMGAAPIGAWALRAGLWMNTALQPLGTTEVSEEGSSEVSFGDIVSRRTDATALFALGLGRKAELGLAIPVVVDQRGLSTELIQTSIGKKKLRSGLLGDLTMHAKVELLASRDRAWRTALALVARAPTGKAEELVGSGGLVLEPLGIVSWRRGQLRTEINLGYRYRQTKAAVVRREVSPGVMRGEIGDELVYRLGTIYDTEVTSSQSPWQVLAELSGYTQAQDPFGAASLVIDPLRDGLDLQGGLRRTLPAFGGFLRLQAGLGTALLGGYAGPKLRVLLGVDYLTREPFFDDDRDRVRNADDGCANEAEDQDGFEDEDGCPELDNDGDGIPDVDDDCPLEAEDKDGFEDLNGCPELTDQDTDGDGVSDAEDKCLTDPEDADGFEDDDGCPEADNDDDGILDGADKCPQDAEDKDKFQDDDGCPEADNDNDGLLDAADKCPNDAEDKDKFQDDDGCPEADNDGDGLTDINDLCPNDAEDFNGVQDDDGCPDKGKKGRRK